MVHTLSGIVLHRLRRMMRTGDVPTEAVEVVTAMVDRVHALDPAFFEKVGEAPLEAAQVVQGRWPEVHGDAGALGRRIDAHIGAHAPLPVNDTARAPGTTRR